MNPYLGFFIIASIMLLPMGTFPVSFFGTVFAEEEYKNDIYVDPYPDILITDPDNYDPNMVYPPKPVYDSTVYPPSQVSGLRTDEIVNMVVVGYTDTKYITRNIDQNMETVRMQTHFPYVDSMNGMVPYVMEETPESILVTVAGGQFDFNKIFGDVSVREGTFHIRAAETYQHGDQVIVSDSYVVRMAEMGSDVWSSLDVNNAPLTVTIDEVDDELFITYTRTNAEGVFETEYKVMGNELKTTATFTNNQYTNHKFAFTETIILDDNLIELNKQTIDLNQFVGQSFDKATLEENRDIVIEAKNLFYSAGLGMENLWAVHIHEDNKISLDYANDFLGVEHQTQVGETVSLDPTITLSEANICNAVKQSPAGSSTYTKYCGYGWGSGYFWQWEGAGNRLDRFAANWDISTVPSTATVTNINLQASQFGYGNYGANDSGDCTFYSIDSGWLGDTTSNGQTGASMYADVWSGTLFGTASANVYDSNTGDQIGCNHPVSTNWGGPAYPYYHLGGDTSRGHATDGWDGFNAAALTNINTAITNGDTTWSFGIKKDVSSQTTTIKGHWWDQASLTLTYVAPSTASAPTWDIRDVDGNTDDVGGLADYSGWEHKQAIKIKAVEAGDVLHSATVPLGIFQSTASGNVWAEVISGTATYGNDNPTANIRATSNLVDVTTLSDCANTSSTSCLADVTFIFATAETLQEHDYIAITTDASAVGWQNSHVAIGQITQSSAASEGRYYMNQGSTNWTQGQSAASNNNISMKLNTTPIVDNYPNISLAWHNTDDASLNPAVTGWKVERSLVGDKTPDTEDTFNTDNFADVGTQVQVVTPPQTYTAPAVPATRNYWMDAAIRDGFGIKISNGHPLIGNTVTEVSFWVSRDEVTSSATYEIYAENNASVMQNSFCSAQPVQDLTYTTLTDGSGETKITCDTGSWDVNSNGGNDIIWITTNASNEEMLIAVDDTGDNPNEDTYINRNSYILYNNVGVKWEAKYGPSGTVGMLNWNSDTNANDQASTLDLGSALSDTDWILRYKLDITNVDIASQVHSEHIYFRMTDTVTTGHNSGNADYVSLSVLRDVGSSGGLIWGVNAVDNGTELASACTTCFGTDFALDTYWIEMSRDGDEFTIKQYSDAEYTDLVQTVTETQASVTGLRYFQAVVFTNGYADRAGNISGTLDDLQIWNAPSGTLHTYSWETVTANTGSSTTTYADNFPSRMAGADYVWRVSGINSFGTSSASPSSDPLTLLDVPQAPASVTSSNPELNQMNVGWAEVTGQYAVQQGTTLLDTDFSSDAGWLDGGTKGVCANDATCSYKLDTEIDTTAEVLIWDGTRTDQQATCQWTSNYDFDQCDGGNSLSFDLGQDLSNTWVAEFDLKINDNDQTTCSDVSDGYHGCYTSRMLFGVSNQDASVASFYVDSDPSSTHSASGVGWDKFSVRDVIGSVLTTRGDGTSLYSRFHIVDNNVDNDHSGTGIEFWEDSNLTGTNYGGNGGAPQSPTGPHYNAAKWDAEPNDSTAGNECGSGTKADPYSSYCTGDEFRVKIIRDGFDTYLKIYDLGSGALLFDLANTIEQTGTNASGRHQDMRYFNVQSYGCVGPIMYPSNVYQYCDQRGSFHGEIDNLIIVDGATSAGVSYYDADGGSDILGYKIFDSKDDSSYTTIHDIYDGDQGTNYGALSGATGHIDNYAWDFDGSGDTVNVNSVSFQGHDGFTASAWVYPHSLGDSAIAGVDGVWKLGQLSGIPTFSVHSGGTDYVAQGDVGSELTLNAWNHVVGTFDGATTTVKVYVDSVVENTHNGAISSMVSGVSVPMKFGMAVGGAPSPDYQTDFSSSTGWSATGSGIGINNGVIEWDGNRQNVNKGVAYDLGTALSNSAFVAEFDLEFTSMGATGGGGTSVMGIMLTDTDETSNSGDCRDYIGLNFAFRTAHNPSIYNSFNAIDDNAGTKSWAHNSWSGTGQCVGLYETGTDDTTDPAEATGSPLSYYHAGDTFHIKIIRESTTSYKVEIWDQKDGNLLDTLSGGVDSNTQGLQYMLVQAYFENSNLTATWTGTIDNMKIYDGVSSTTPPTFNGLIDQVVIYDIALDQAEIDTLYNSGTGVTTPSTINLIAHYDFEDLGDTSTTTVNILPAYADSLADGYPNPNGNNFCDGNSLSAYTVGSGSLFSSITNLNNAGSDCFMWFQDYDISGLPTATITDVVYNFATQSVSNSYYQGTTPFNNIHYVPLESVRANAPLADVFSQLKGVASADYFVSDSSLGHQAGGVTQALDLGTNADTTLTDAIANGDSHWGFGSVHAYNNGDPFDANQIYGWYIVGGYNIDVTYDTVANAETLDNHADFVDTYLDENDDYYHKVSAITAVGEGAVSTASTPIPTKPLPPTVTAVSASDVAIDINWTNPTGAAESGFKIEKSTDAGTTWTDLVADTANTNLTYQDVGLQQTTSYYYRVSTINPSGTSASSNESFSLTFGAPDAPTTLTAVAEESVIIKLDWVAGADNGGAITGYKIETSTDAGATWQVLVPDTGNTNITYDDGVSNSLTIGNTYHYRTSAINAYGTSPVSNVANALAGDAPAQAIISTVTALAGLAIRLDWVHQPDNSYSLSQYLVEYSTDSGSSWNGLGNGLLAGSATTFTHSSLTEGTNYQYRLTAGNALGDAPVSTATANKVAGDVPDAPVSLTSALQASPFAVNLSWQVPPDDHEYAVDEYRVYRDGTLLTSGITVLTYSDTTIVGGTTYVYKVQAHNALGWSGDSNTTSIQAGTAPDAPTNLTATAVADYDADLAWTAGYNGGLAISGYKIEHSVDGTNWTTLVADTGNANTTYTADYTSAESGNTKYWKVSAINVMGTSPASSSANVKLGDVPSAVTGVTAPPQSATEIDLTWSVPSDNGYAISAYQIERSLDNSNWTTVTSTHTTTSFSDTGLTASTTYYYKVSGINTLGTGVASTAVQTATYGVPDAIDDLSLTVPSTTGINLSWTEPVLNGYALVEYEIFRSEDGTNWTSIATQTAITYADTGLNINDLYYYKVTVENTYGTSADSNIESTPTLPTPTAASSLTVVSNTEITVQWNQPTGDQQSGYKIERSTDGTNWSVHVADTGNTNTTYSDTGLTANTTYHYRISVINAAGTSTPSPASSDTTFGPPEAPTGLTATSLVGAEIQIDWVAPTDTNGAAISGYKIERSTDGSTYSVLVADTASTVITYTDSGLTTGTTYHYRVSAINTYGVGAASGSDSTIASDIPAQVTNLTATAVPDKEIDLAWTAPNDGGSSITGYKIQRSTDGTTYSVLVADTGSAATTYSDINLTIGTAYYYKVNAINIVGDGPESAAANTTAGDVPSKITVLNASAQAGQEITITWTAPAENAYAISSYLIQSSTDQQTWSTAGSSATTTFTDTSLAIGSTYYYRIHATNALGDSEKSGIVNDLAGDTPSQTTGVTATVLSDTSIRLNWSAPSDNAYAISGYFIEGSADNTTFTTVVANTQSTALVHTETGLTPQTDYYYRISAINILGTGTASTSVLGTTLDAPDAVTDLAGSISGSDLDFTWSAPADNGSTISKYIFQVQSIDTGNWLTLDNNVQGTTFTHTGINDTFPNTQISYRVYAVNAIGQSSASNVEQVWTSPTAPTGITAQSLDFDETTISWTTTTGLTYKLEHSTDNTTFTTEADPATTPYTDTGLTLGSTHYYKVYAINPSGVTSPASAVVTVTTLYYPTAPLNLIITPDSSDLHDIQLTWSAPADDGGSPILNYTVERSQTSSSTGFSALPTNCPPAQDCTYTYYDELNLAAQTQYWYRVLAENTIGSDSTNGYSAVATYTTPTPPQAPSNLDVSPTGTNNDAATLTWNAPADTGTHSISGYKVERQINLGNWALAIETNNAQTTITDTNLIEGTIYTYRVTSITQAGYSASTSNTAQVEMLEVNFTITGTPIGGNTITIQPDFELLEGVPAPTWTKVRIFENSAYEATQNINQVLTQGQTFGANLMYFYPTVATDYYAIATINHDGALTQWTSNTVSITPASPFQGDITFNELRDQSSNWSESNLDMQIQPAGSDIIIRYQPEGTPILNALTGVCTANCPVISGYGNVQSIVNATTTQLDFDPNTVGIQSMDPNKHYYISVYVNPTFEYPPIAVDGETVHITCNTNSGYDCQEGNIPKAYASTLAMKSTASLYAPPSLGIDQLGNLFGLPLVFVFVIGVAAVFTGRSAQMGIIFIAATLGVMGYLGYLSFDFDPDNNSNIITWTLIIIVAVLGAFIGKRW